jgi:hypothetical protein
MPIPLEGHSRHWWRDARPCFLGCGRTSRFSHTRAIATSTEKAMPPSLENQARSMGKSWPFTKKPERPGGGVFAWGGRCRDPGRWYVPVDECRYSYETGTTVSWSNVIMPASWLLNPRECWCCQCMGRAQTTRWDPPPASPSLTWFSGRPSVRGGRIHMGYPRFVRVQLAVPHPVRTLPQIGPLVDMVEPWPCRLVL